MAGKRSNITKASDKTSVGKGGIGSGTRRRTSTLAIDIGEIKEGHLRLVIKGVVVPKPPAPPFDDRKVTKPVHG